ncbi:MAG: hypothetical protein LBC85_03665 [Fibromonadaceae bacterium]|jgi:outer membrane protein assembly factor BamB|nr:hypothetical protein [Fibromonadaceae bacterium]
MTEEEYDALNELLTKTTPKVGANGTGFVSKRNAKLFGLDDPSINYLITRSLATHKSPAEIIGVMVREKIAEASYS